MTSAEVTEIEAEIAATRDRLSDTIDRIQGKLTVSGLVDEVMGSSYVPRFESGPDVIVGLMRRHPLPMMVAAAGIGWLIYRMNRQAAATLPRVHDDDFIEIPVPPPEGREEALGGRPAPRRRDRGRPAGRSADPSVRRHAMNEVEHHYGEVGRTQHERVHESTGPAKRAASAVRDTLGSAYEGAASWASDQYDSATRTATYARRRTVVGVGRTRQNVETLVHDNPVMIGVVGFAAGLLLGALLPTTRRENSLIGPYADEAKDQGLRYVRDLAEQGRHFVEENVDRASRADSAATGRDATGA